MGIFNRSTDKKKRKALRNGMPKAEKILWSKLKGKQFHGYKFRRQYGVDKFVVDFYCPELKLALEIDGDSHFLDGQQEYDIKRQSFIESKGIEFLRFSNNDIYNNLNGVLTTIEDFIGKRDTTP